MRESLPHWLCLSGQSVAVATQPCCGTEAPALLGPAPILPPAKTGPEHSAGCGSPGRTDKMKKNLYQREKNLSDTLQLHRLIKWNIRLAFSLNLLLL